MLSSFKLFGHLGDLDNIELQSAITPPSGANYTNYWFFFLGN